jgi:hypothetical protein
MVLYIHTQIPTGESTGDGWCPDKDRRPNLGKIAKIRIYCVPKQWLTQECAQLPARPATAVRQSGSWGDFVKNYWKRLSVVGRGPGPAQCRHGYYLGGVGQPKLYSVALPSRASNRGR